MTFEEWIKERFKDQTYIQYEIDDLKAAYEFGRNTYEEEWNKVFRVAYRSEMGME